MYVHSNKNFNKFQTYNINKAPIDTMETLLNSAKTFLIYLQLSEAHEEIASLKQQCDTYSTKNGALKSEIANMANELKQLADRSKVVRKIFISNVNYLSGIRVVCSL